VYVLNFFGKKLSVEFANFVMRQKKMIFQQKQLFNLLLCRTNHLR